MAMNLEARDTSREQMLELLADVMLSDMRSPDVTPVNMWGITMNAARAVLSIGGGVAAYAHFPDPRQLYIPTRTNQYAVGWVRSNPKKGRLIVDYDHLADIETRDEEQKHHQADPTMHVLGVYFGKPFSQQELTLAFNACMERIDAGQKGVPSAWVERVYGAPPSAEVMDDLNRTHFEQHSNWLWGPAFEYTRTVKCDHEYGMFDSCPGCDHQQEMGLGPWAGMQTTNTEG